jgi:hypothetical protein
VWHVRVASASSSTSDQKPTTSCCVCFSLFVLDL